MNMYFNGHDYVAANSGEEAQRLLCVELGQSESEASGMRLIPGNRMITLTDPCRVGDTKEKARRSAACWAGNGDKAFVLGSTEY